MTGLKLYVVAQPTWALRLSNEELSDEFGAALQHNWENSPGLSRRLDVLSGEIGRRERAGQWTEADWMIESK